MENFDSQHVPFTDNLDALVSDELSGLLSTDVDQKGNPTFMRDVWLGTLAGQTPQEIAEAYGHKNAGATKTFINSIRMLLGDIPLDAKLHNSLKHAELRRHKWLKTNVSAPTRLHLENLEGVTLDDHEELARALAPAMANEAPRKILAAPLDTPGIYVYSYPHLLHTASFANVHPLVKVGASEAGVGQRVARQASQTEVPEELVLMGVWACSEPFKAEAKIHRILKEAGLHRSTSKTGQEWFQSSLELIDAIAAAMDLEIVEQDAIGANSF